MEELGIPSWQAPSAAAEARLFRRRKRRRSVPALTIRFLSLGSLELQWTRQLELRTAGAMKTKCRNRSYVRTYHFQINMHLAPTSLLAYFDTAGASKTRGPMTSYSCQALWSSLSKLNPPELRQGYPTILKGPVILISIFRSPCLISSTYEEADRHRRQRFEKKQHVRYRVKYSLASSAERARVARQPNNYPSKLVWATHPPKLMPVTPQFLHFRC